MQVELTKALTINVTGYDREPRTFEPGEQDVPPRVGAFVAAHPEFGRVVEKAAEKAPSTGRTRARQAKAEGAASNEGESNEGESSEGESSEGESSEGESNEGESNEGESET